MVPPTSDDARRRPGCFRGRRCGRAHRVAALDARSAISRSGTPAHFARATARDAFSPLAARQPHDLIRRELVRRAHAAKLLDDPVASGWLAAPTLVSSFLRRGDLTLGDTSYPHSFEKYHIPCHSK